MTGSINSLIGPGDESWNTTEQDAKRQAIAALRGYAYQLHQSLAAWIALPDDATLHLEISEDYAQIARDPASLGAVLTATQVKDTRESGSVTLNSADVKAAIRNFWGLHQANPDKPVRLAFLTTSPIGQERFAPLDGGKGLELWHRAARAGSLNALRSGLVQRFTSEADEESGLAAFLRDSDNDSLRRNLIAAIRWIAGAPPIAAIEADNRAALVVLGQSLGGLPDLSARAADLLLARILSVIVGGGDRRLRRGDLLFALQEAVSVRVPAHRALVGPTVIPRGLNLDATGAWRLIAPAPPRCTPRETAVQALRNALGPTGSAWLHGATGLGKSLLAELAANAIGGPWRLLDLRGATGPTARERIVATRLAILGEPAVAGLVIDDLSPVHQPDTEAVLGELALSLQQRGIPLIVTSNQPPGQRLKRALELADAGVHAAPSFESEDAAALVAAYGGDPARWGWFALLVGGGHPQLVDVAIAGLANAGWPEDAMKSWATAGMKNPDVEAEREAARRRLLAELSSDALALLARTVRIYGSFDRALGVAVGGVAPSLAAPGMALDSLTGHWIERLDFGRMRSSPLVTGLDTEMLDAEALKTLDLAIVVHIMTRETVDADLLDTAFFHAWLAGDESWVNVLVQHVIATSDEDRAKLASLMPMFREAQADPTFLAERPYVTLLLRLAQHLLKSAIGSDAEVARSARSLIERLDAMTEEDTEIRQSLVGIILMKLLFDAYGFGRIPGWFDHLQRFALIVENNPDFREIADRIGTGSDANPTGFLFVAHAVRLPGVAAFASLFDALDHLPPSARQVWLDAMNEPPIALPMIIDNAWLKETQRDDFEAQATADTFAQLGQMALNWQAERLAGRCFRTQALVLDEYVKDRTAAFTALDAAAERLPGNFDIERERGKIAWRGDEYADAYRILRRLEDRYEEIDPLDAAFALRQAAISAGHIGEPTEAARLFDKAQALALAGRDGRPSPFSVGLAADAAAIRFGAGEEARAVRAMVSVLDDVATIDPQERPTSHAVHLLVKHLVLWMREKQEPLLVEGEPPFYPPGAASNPDPKPGLADFPVTPAAPAWMLLARVALQAGVPADEIIAWPGLIAARADADLDAMVRYDLLDHAIAKGNIGDFQRFLNPAMEGFAHMEARRAAGREYDPREMSATSIAPVSPGALMDGNQREYLRDAALAQAIVAWAQPEASVASHLIVHDALRLAAGYDAMPEWGDAAPDDPDDFRQIIARVVASLSNSDGLKVEELFVAHLRLLEWALSSNHQKAVLPVLARRVRQDWSAILATRRALLVMPALNVPAIETVLDSGGEDAAFIARVLLAAEPAVSVGFDTKMRAMLENIRDST